MAQLWFEMEQAEHRAGKAIDRSKRKDEAKKEALRTRFIIEAGAATASETTRCASPLGVSDKAGTVSVAAPSSADYSSASQTGSVASPGARPAPPWPSWAHTAWSASSGDSD